MKPWLRNLSLVTAGVALAVLHSVDGTLVVETDANSSVMPEKHLQKQ
jgi:hypothetical protein